MRFLWAFNHDESTRSFARAAQLDPECAACYWGVALTVVPIYNLPVMRRRGRRLRSCAHKAQRAAAHRLARRPCPDRPALAKRYPNAQP